MDELLLVLITHYQRSDWSFNGEPSYENLVWHGDSEKPSKEHLESIGINIVMDNANRNIEMLRQDAYRNESDPLFFKWQRGEAEKEEWINKVESIKSKYPYLGDNS